MEKPKISKSGRYWALLDTWVGWITAAIRLDKPYTQILLIPKISRSFLIPGREFLSQTGHEDFEHHRRKNTWYFVTITGSEDCPIWVEPGSHNCAFYSDEEKENLCRIIEMEGMKLLRECVLSGQAGMQHAGGEFKEYHAVRYHR